MESEFDMIEEAEEHNIFSRNSRITEFLEFCLKPKSKSEMKSILLNFWEKFQEFEWMNNYISEFDICCMFVLNYIYEHNGVSSSVLSQSIYIYLNQIGSSPSDFINYKSSLPSSTNLDNLKQDLPTVFTCVESANLGFLKFLKKFGFLEFPTEVTENNCNIIQKLVDEFNYFYQFSNSRVDVQMKLDDFLNQVRPKDWSFRRSLLVFYFIGIILECQVYEKIRLKHISEYITNYSLEMELLCVDRFACLTTFIEATNETFLTFRDIENFQTTFLKFLPNEVLISVQKTARDIFSTADKFFPEMMKGEFENYNPRSLKDLARCKIRGCLQSSKILPNQVYQLPLPVSLKEFLLFGNEDIWQCLKFYQIILYKQRERNSDSD